MANGRKRGASSSYPSPPYSPIAKRSRGGSLLLGGGRVASAVGRVAGRTVARYAKAVSPMIRAGSAAYKAGKVIKQFVSRPKPMQRRMGSSDNSKALGKFQVGKKITSLSDKYTPKGFVKKVEWGGVVTDATRQVTYVAHTTFPAQQAARVMCAALLKKLLLEAGHRVKSETEVLLSGQYYNSQINILYKTKDGNTVSEQVFTVTTSNTFADIASAIYAWLLGLSETANLPNQFLFMRYYIQFGVAVDAKLLQSELDLTTLRFDCYSKSHLKIQNRTINSAGNDTSEDVDNVPINGKHFEYRTNSTTYRDYGEPTVATTAAITTSPALGVLPSTIGAETGTKMYQDLPDRTQFVGCRKVGKCFLDPGAIKTSTMVDFANLSMNRIVNLLFARKPNVGSGLYNQFWIGRTRLFAFEKMINAVAMDATNQFNLAVEHQFEVGMIAVAKRPQHTAPAIDVTNATVV